MQKCLKRLILYNIIYWVCVNPLVRYGSPKWVALSEYPIQDSALNRWIRSTPPILGGVISGFKAECIRESADLIRAPLLGRYPRTSFRIPPRAYALGLERQYSAALSARSRRNYALRLRILSRRMKLGCAPRVPGWIQPWIHGFD